MFWALCEHKCKSRVWVWTFMTHLKDSCYLRTLVSILSKRKKLNLASLFEYLWFNRRVWFIGSSVGIHQHYDTPNRHILCLLEMVHSTVFPGTDHIHCELFIAHNASANGWFCYEMEWDAFGRYCVRGIHSDIEDIASGQWDHVWDAEPRSLLPNQKQSWDVDVWKCGLEIQWILHFTFWDAALSIKYSSGGRRVGKKEHILVRSSNLKSYFSLLKKRTKKRKDPWSVE